jgi:hypothetical protein
MTFKAQIDGTPKYGDDPLVSDDAEEVSIITRYTDFTLWTDGEELHIQYTGKLKSIHFDGEKQILLRME